MKKFILFSTILLGGCKNYYQEYYQQSPSYQQENTIFHSTEPKIYRSSNLETDSDIYIRKGYGIIGTTNFNSGEIGSSSQSKLIEFAKKVGAEVVLWSKRYTHTVSGTTSYNYYTPQTQTSYHSGIISNNYQPLSTYNYSGTTTTYSQQQNTAYVPYSVRRYDYTALFLGKLINLRFGFSARNLSSKERIKYHLKSGIYVLLIATDGPAFDSDLAEGDIVTKIDGKKVKNVWSFSLIDINNFKRVRIEFLRDGKRKFTTMKFNH